MTCFKTWLLVLMISTSMMAQHQALRATSANSELYHLETAAEQGNADAQFNLGVMYEQGQGIAQDYKKALEWYGKAAVQGDTGAQLNLGAMYHKGQGVSQNYKKAKEFFEQAAAQGNTDAQRNLGIMYRYGQGVDRDFIKAFKWYLKSDKLLK